MFLKCTFKYYIFIASKDAHLKIRIYVLVGGGSQVNCGVYLFLVVQERTLPFINPWHLRWDEMWWMTSLHFQQNILKVTEKDVFYSCPVQSSSLEGESIFLVAYLPLQIYFNMRTRTHDTWSPLIQCVIKYYAH